MSDTRVYLGRYEIVRELGRGGMSVVYLARDLQLLSKEVVVKELLVEMSADPYLRQKLEQEVEALIRIKHPGVVDVTDKGQTANGNPCFVMQYIKGVTLRQALDQGPLDLARAANLIRQIADALQAAHDNGIWHRDLKPSNVMLQSLPNGDERAVLIDFGIAAVQDSVYRAEKTRVVGTTLYMAPEQFGGKTVAASDTYALGVVAYEMVTGSPPFAKNSMAHLAMEPEVKPPRELRADLPEAGARAILRAMSFAPAGRQSKVCEFGEDMQNAVSAKRGPTLHGENAPAIAHVLFMDLVGFSPMTMEQQRDYIQELQTLVQATQRFRAANDSGDLICLPRGDGMALVFFGDPAAPAQCALEVAAALKSRPHLQLRMGIHSGPVYRVADVKGNADVAGGGINMAQRVMDSGDPGHILVSKAAADTLLQMKAWMSCLSDLGERTVKHGVQIHIYNLTTSELGNPSRPSRLAPVKGSAARAKRLSLALAAVVLIAAVAFAGWWWSRPVLQLSYSVVVQKYRDGKPYGDPFRLVREILFERDYRAAFEVTNQQAGYLYILNEGPHPSTGALTFNILRPIPGGSAEIGASARTRIPPSSYILFDAATGKETVYLVWSHTPVPEIERLKILPVVHNTIVVEDPAETKRLHEFLDPRVEQTEVGKNEQAKQTDLRMRGTVLVHAIPLEHQ